MGKKRTANAGVSIFASEHDVEKKKRKASDISIFDHVAEAQLQKQSVVTPAPAPAPAPAQQAHMHAAVQAQVQAR